MLQFIYILCIYNIAVYTLICTGLLAFIAINEDKKKKRGRGFKERRANRKIDVGEKKMRTVPIP